MVPFSVLDLVAVAEGATPRTFGAMRRDPRASDAFPQDVQELQALLAPVRPGQQLQAVPGGGTEVPLWILGSSLFGAQLAALLDHPHAMVAVNVFAADTDAEASWQHDPTWQDDTALCDQT